MIRNKPWWQKPGITLGIGLVVLILLGGAAAGLYMSQLPPDQPIAFPHRAHVAIGASCLYCHAGAATGPDAGLPSTEKCWGCHQQVPKQSAELDKLVNYVKTGQQIPWVPVAIQPDFVHFNHQPHIAKGINCETCHGPVSTMTVAEPQARQNMGWCLECHKQNSPDQATWIRLSDCATCHY
jgi:hypothetical protein